jgi:hypothetical protein
MPSRSFPKPWSVKPIPSGYRVIDANGIVLAHVYGQPNGAIAVSDSRLTNDEARRISKLITRLPELVELERDGNKARSRRKPQPLRSKPVTIGDLIREGKLLEVHCGNCRPERHLYLNPEILRLPKRMPVPEVAGHLVCSKCGARNSETYNPIWASQMPGSAVSRTIRTTARGERTMPTAPDKIPDNIEFAAKELLEAPSDQRPAMLKGIAKALTRRLLHDNPGMVSERFRSALPP